MGEHTENIKDRMQWVRAAYTVFVVALDEMSNPSMESLICDIKEVEYLELKVILKPGAEWD